MSRATTAARLGTLAVAGLLAVSVAACGDSEDSGGTASGGGGGDIPIGFLLTTTGATAVVGQSAEIGARAAIDAINAAGGVDGRKLKGEFEDTQLQPTLAVSQLNQLIHVQNIKAVVAQGSTIINAIKPIAKQQKVILINHVAVDPTIADGPNFTFTTTSTAEQEAAPLTKYMREEIGAQTVATLADDSAIGQSAAKAVKDAFTAAGGQDVGDEKYPVDSTDFRTQLVKIKSNAPDALFMAPIGPQQASNILRQADQLGLDIPIFANNYFENPDLPKLAGPTADGVVYSHAAGLADGSPKGDALQKAWTDAGKEGEPTAQAATAYDAVYLLADAFGEVGDDTSKVRDFLLTGHEFTGALGGLKFDENGQAHVAMDLREVKDGEFVTLQTAEASAD